MSASEDQAAETSKDTDDRKVDRPWNIIHIRLPPRKRLPDASLILSKKVPGTASKEVPKPITENPGKNLITTPVQGEANSHSPRAGLPNQANSNIMSKARSAESESDTSGDKLLDEINISTLSKNLRVAAEEQGSDADSYAAKQVLCEEANNNNPNMILPLPVQELPEDDTDSSPSKNHATTGKQGEEERNNSPRKKVLYNTDSKLGAEAGNSPNWNIRITAVKYVEVFEGANHGIPTKPSDEIKSSSPSIRPTDPANKSTPHKRLTSSLQATGTSQNTPGINISPSVGQAVEQSTNAANMEVINVYQEFEEKVKKNVYLDNLSHQATEAKTNPSRTLSTTTIECEVFEHVNHPIPTKNLSDVARNNAPSNRPTDPVKKSTPRKKPRTSAVQATGTSQNTFGMKLSTSDGEAVNQSKGDADLKAIKQYSEQTNNTKRKEVPKLISDNPGKNLITDPEQGEASRQSPRVGLCDGADSNTLSKTQSAESQSDASGDKLTNVANDSTLSKNLRVTAEEQGSDASSYAGLSEEANNNIPSMIIPLPDQELPEDHIDNSPSKNLTTTRKQGKDEHNKYPRKKLLYDTDSKVEDEEGNYPSWNRTIAAVKYEKVFAEANHPIPCKKLSDDAKLNGPSNRPTDLANNKPVYKRRRTSSVQATGTSQNTPGMKLSASVAQTAEQSTIAANMEVINVYQEFEEKVKRNVYHDNLSHQATEAKTNPSRTLSTTAIECEVFEHVNHPIPTKNLSDVARNNAPSNRPTDPVKKSTTCKKPHTSAIQASGTSQNTFGMKLSTSDGEAVNKSKRAADLEAMKQYPEQINNTECKEVPKLINDNPRKNPTTAPEQGEASSQVPIVGLCGGGGNSSTLSKTQSAESQSDASGDKLPNVANDSTLSKSLRVAAEEQGSDACSYAGLSEEANNNIPSMIIPRPDQELPEDHINNSPSKNLTTTGKQGKDEHNKSPRKKLLYDTDSKVEDEEGNYLSWNPRITAVKCEKVFAEANHPIPCKKLSDDAESNGPSNRPTDLVTEAKTNPSTTLSTTAIKCHLFEHAYHTIPNRNIFNVARNNAPSNRPTNPDKKSNRRKPPALPTVLPTTGHSQKNTRKRPPLPPFLDGVSKERILFWSFDGKAEDVLEDFDGYIKSARNLGLDKGVKVKADHIFGREKLMYTTPNTKEPVYAVVHYKDLLAIFIIKADEWYQKGYYVDGQFYEVIPDNNEKPFIEGANMLTFGGNYAKLCDGKPGELVIGLPLLKEKLKELQTTRGRLDPYTFAPFTLYLCEGPKIKQACIALRRSLLYAYASRLHRVQETLGVLIVNWRFLSKIILLHVHQLNHIQLTEAEIEKWKGIPESSTLKEAMETIRMVYVRALSKYGVPADPRVDSKKLEKYRPSARREIIQRGGASRSTYHTDSLTCGLKGALSASYATQSSIGDGGTQVLKKEDPVDRSQQLSLSAKRANGSRSERFLVHVQAANGGSAKSSFFNTWAKQCSSVHVQAANGGRTKNTFFNTWTKLCSSVHVQAANGGRAKTTTTFNTWTQQCESVHVQNGNAIGAAGSSAFKRHTFSSMRRITKLTDTEITFSNTISSSRCCEDIAVCPPFHMKFAVPSQGALGAMAHFARRTRRSSGWTIPLLLCRGRG